MNEAEKLSGAEEYISAEIDLDHELNPDQERALRETIGKHPGLRDDLLSLSGKRITVYYDPAQISKDDLIALIKRGSAEAADVQTQRAPTGL